MEIYLIEFALLKYKYMFFRKYINLKDISILQAI